MTGNEYQRLAARTIRKGATRDEMEQHALHGLVGEIGELHSIYQKFYQGHDLNYDHCFSEVSDICWFIAEYCTAFDVQLDDVFQYNIEKLRRRYPEGFDEERSLHRATNDI